MGAIPTVLQTVTPIRQVAMADIQTETCKGNIIVVDDTPVNLRLLSAMLTRQGYHVRAFGDGPTALDAAHDCPPDLFLLDITMPGMNGYEVCEALKREEQTCDIPIIFISALDEVLDKVKAFTVGGVDYITKPFHFEEVLVRIQTHITLRRLQRQLQSTNTELEQRVAERTAELVALNESYERFVPREFLSLLQKEHIGETRLGDQVQRDMTVMFSDIRSFTNLSETMTPQENFNFINAYLGRVGPVIRQHRGIVDKFVGDGIMALFPRQPSDALNAAIDTIKAVRLYNQHRHNTGYNPIAVSIGMHTGSLMLGIIGESQRMQGTVISDAVNIAARLERLTRLYGASIVISADMFQRVNQRERYQHRFVDKVQVNGKRAPVSVYEIFDADEEPQRAAKVETRGLFQEGLERYYAKAFSEASVKFHKVLERNPSDRAARMYLERAGRFMVQGVPSNWDGVERLSEK